jgi:hypothetical protein
VLFYSGKLTHKRLEEKKMDFSMQRDFGEWRRGKTNTGDPCMLEGVGTDNPFVKDKDNFPKRHHVIKIKTPVM